MHFYDSAAELRPIFQIKKEAKEQYAINPDKFFALDAVEDLIDYEEDDGGYESVILEEDHDDSNDLFSERISIADLFSKRNRNNDF